MNFVFFILDELRAESLGCYGHPCAHTPNFDRLAREGVRFSQCHVQHTVCTPSRCSFLTGWYPHTRGHRTLWHLLREDEPNLLRRLKETGHEVVMGGKNDAFSPRAFPLGVDEARVQRRSKRHRLLPWASRNPFRAGTPEHLSFLHQSHPDLRLENLFDFACVDGAVEYLRAGPKRPFALYLPLTFPHPPYHAPAPFAGLHDPDALPPLRPAGLPGKPDFHELIRGSRGLDVAPPELFRRVQATYLDMIGATDALLGFLLDALDETGLAEDTALFVFSDHGDWAGDFGLVEKWPSALDDTLTRVPLIVRAPGGRAGHVVESPVELFDIMPTALELAGVTVTHTHFARSLVRELGGAPGDATRAVFAEGGYDVGEPHCFEGHAPRGDMRPPTDPYHPKLALQQSHPGSVRRAAMIRTSTHKLVRRPGGVGELYDLVADPRELFNRIDDPLLAAERVDLERRLLDRMITTSDVTPALEDSRAVPPEAS